MKRVLTVIMGLAFTCRTAPEPEPHVEPTKAETVETTKSEPEASEVAPKALRHVVVTDPSELSHIPLDSLETLDLALSVSDARERASDTIPSEPRCAGLDLLRLAADAPKLRSLRLSGCEEALRGGLGAFNSIVRLELADIRLDAVIIGRIAQLQGLRELSFTRVSVKEDEPLDVLGRDLSIEALELRDLERDSAIGRLLGEFRDLRRAHLEGEWAGYHAMTALARAKRLEKLRLEETSIGNFALAQIRSLPALVDIELVGSTFRDDTPLVLRDLPIRRFVCACPRFGDTGVKHVRYMTGLEELELLQSQITGTGLPDLEDLAKLRRVRIGYRTLDNATFEGLARLPALTALHLEHIELAEPGAIDLGKLVRLRELVIDARGFDDAAAEQLATLVELRELDLSGTAISDRGLAHLASLGKLEILRLHHTRVTNHGLEHLSGLSALRVLELDHTDLVDEGLGHLRGLSALRELRLDHTLVTDAGIEHLVELRNLERLNLASTVVTAEGVAKLRKLPELRAVDLRGTRVPGEEADPDP